MDFAYIAATVDKALTELIDEQPELLELGVTERALSHHLANYIARSIDGAYHVDVEYNRHFDTPKRLNLPPRDALDREIRATTVFPDIIVHRRNSDADNLLVLEMKKPGENLEYDDLKLKAFRLELGYKHAAHVILGRANQEVVREVIWING